MLSTDSKEKNRKKKKKGRPMTQLPPVNCVNWQELDDSTKREIPELHMFLFIKGRDGLYRPISSVYSGQEVIAVTKYGIYIMSIRSHTFTKASIQTKDLPGEIEIFGQASKVENYFSDKLAEELNISKNTWVVNYVTAGPKVETKFSEIDFKTFIKRTVFKKLDIDWFILYELFLDGFQGFDEVYKDASK